MVAVPLSRVTQDVVIAFPVSLLEGQASFVMSWRLVAGK